jgi:hypothetical protein
MFREMIIAAAAAGLLISTATVATSKVRHHSGFQYAPSYGYSAGERSNPTNTNGF